MCLPPVREEGGGEEVRDGHHHHRRHHQLHLQRLRTRITTTAIQDVHTQKTKKRPRRARERKWRDGGEKTDAERNAPTGGDAISPGSRIDG